MIDAVSRIRETRGDLELDPRDRLLRTLSLAVGFGVAATAATVGAVGQSPFADALPAAATAVGWEPVSLGLLGFVSLAVAFTATDDLATVGFVSLGVFALLGAGVEGAFLPAAGVVLLGGAVATARSLPTTRVRNTGFAWAVALAVAAGTTASLAGAVGTEPTILRPVGGIALFAGLLLLPVWLGAGSIDAAAGAFVAALLAGAGWLAPVVTETVLLSGLSVVGVPTLLVAVGVGGGVTAASCALRRRRLTTALATGLVLTAGVPASLPTASAALLGVATIALREGESE